MEFEIRNHLMNWLIEPRKMCKQIYFGNIDLLVHFLSSIMCLKIRLLQNSKIPELPPLKKTSKTRGKKTIWPRAFNKKKINPYVIYGSGLGHFQSFRYFASKIHKRPFINQKRQKKNFQKALIELSL